MMNKKAIFINLALVFSFLICILGFAVFKPNYVSSSIVLTQKNPVHILRLKSNPTTGYCWQIESYDSRLLTVVHRYVAPKTNLIGAGGHEVWSFRATEEAFKTAPHEMKIKLIYVRPWEWAKDKQISPENVHKIVISIK